MKLPYPPKCCNFEALKFLENTSKGKNADQYNQFMKDVCVPLIFFEEFETNIFQELINVEIFYCTWVVLPQPWKTAFPLPINSIALSFNLAVVETLEESHQTQWVTIVEDVSRNAMSDNTFFFEMWKS